MISTQSTSEKKPHADKRLSQIWIKYDQIA